MTQEEGLRAGEAAGIQKTTLLVVILICAALSVFFLNTGLLSLFYLAPLGFAVLVSGSVWLAPVAAAVVNAVFCIVTRMIYPAGSVSLWMKIFYFTPLFLGFAWIMGGTHFRTAYRFVLASAGSAVVLLIFLLGSASGFNAMFRDVAEMFSSVIISSSGSDAVRRSSLQQMLTPEKMLEAYKYILLRGGAMISVFFMFFINRKISLAAVWLFKKQKKDRGLAAFFAPSYTIWALSFSLAFVLLTRLLRAEIPEIIAWNVFVVCAILFLAQGAGIAIYFLSRRVSRVFINVLIILVIIIPGLNTAAVAALLLLGIAENWLPFRVPKQGEASTPGL